MPKCAQMYPLADSVGYVVFAGSGWKSGPGSRFCGRTPRFWHGGSPRGPAEEGVGGGKPPPKAGSNYSDRGSTDFGIILLSFWNHFCTFGVSNCPRYLCCFRPVPKIIIFLTVPAPCLFLSVSTIMVKTHFHVFPNNWYNYRVQLWLNYPSKTS